MENIFIKGDRKPYYTQPEVDFNADKGECALVGESYFEATTEFYSPLLNWLEQYFSEYQDKSLIFNFKLSYFNTSSSRSILNILQLLKSKLDEGREITVYWYYEEQDNDMMEEVEDFVLDTGVEIKIIDTAKSKLK